MMSEKSSDFLTQYKAISNKLKKRFLRKPNTTEPSDQFASLAAQCERSDLPQYAALSWLAVAKCEASLAHKNEEAVALQKAGRLFLEAERKNVIGCNEHIQSGIFCLNQVEELWGDDNPMTGALCFETGSALETISPHHAVTFFEKSASLLSHSPALHLHALGKLASAKITVGDYHGAMSLFTDMVSTVYKITASPFGVYKDILVRCEISRVLLILLLQPTPQKISPDLAKFVEKYTWIGEPDPKTVSWLGDRKSVV